MSDLTTAFHGSPERYMASVLYGLRFGIVALAVDRTYPGVVVPADVRPDDALLFLNYGLDLVVPIPDLRVDLVGVLATLSFSRAPRETFVPWGAVRGIVFEGADIAPISDEELDAIAAEHLRGLAPLAVPEPDRLEPPRRLRRITQVDVFSPQAAEPAIDPEETAREFKRSGLRAV